MAVPGTHGFIGQPSTYTGSDGRQYVAILSGVGGWSGAIAAAELGPRVRNGALGFSGAMQDLPAYTTGGSTLLVFALPSQGGPQPASPAPSPAGVIPPDNADQVIETPEDATDVPAVQGAVSSEPSATTTGEGDATAQ